MSLLANGSVWSWCFAVLERVVESGSGDAFTNLWGEPSREPENWEEEREWDGDAVKMNEWWQVVEKQLYMLLANVDKNT